MPYEVVWDDDVEQIVRIVSLIDAVMGSEILAAADLLGSSPITHGTRATRAGYSGMLYRFRVRDGIVVTFNYHHRPASNSIVIHRVNFGR